MEEEEEGKIFGQRAEGGGYNAGFPHNNADCAKARRRFHKKILASKRPQNSSGTFIKSTRNTIALGLIRNCALNGE